MIKVGVGALHQYELGVNINVNCVSDLYSVQCNSYGYVNVTTD